MSIARSAVRGAVWSVGLGVSARAVGAVGTIIIARFIAPEVMGEVLAAWIVAMLGHTVTRMGLDQYIIVKHADGDDVPFHATFWMTIFGALGLGLVAGFGAELGPYLNAPHLSRYLPGCVIAVAIRRIASIPDRILVRDMRFRIVAVAQATSEVVYVVSALLMAGSFAMGGHAVVYGNIIQALVLLAVLAGATSWSQWLAPCRITWKRTRDMLSFGVPLNFETALNVASRMGDNLVFAARFGAGPMGIYSMAYNLADIPATHVGEHVSSVLLPSMSKVPREHRIEVLIRTTALLGLIIFPMAMGLGVVADSLIAVLLPPEWHDVAPLLTALAVLSVFRPVSWVVASYLKVAERTANMFWMEAFKVALLMAGIALLPTPLGACAMVGVAFGAHSVVMILSVAWHDDISPVRFVPGFVRPLLSCVPMVAAVLAVRHGLAMAGVDSPLGSLIAEIATGVVVYVPSAMVLAPSMTRDMIMLLRKAFGWAPRTSALPARDSAEH